MNINRRALFSFLAVAPLAIIAIPTAPRPRAPFASVGIEAGEVVEITLRRPPYDGEYVRQLVERINAYVRDGGSLERGV